MFVVSLPVIINKLRSYIKSTNISKRIHQFTRKSYKQRKKKAQLFRLKSSKTQEEEEVQKNEKTNLKSIPQIPDGAGDKENRIEKYFLDLGFAHRKRIIKYTCERGVKGKYVYIMVVAIYHTRDVSGMEHHGESLETSW